MAIVYSVGGKSDIQKLNAGRICYAGVEMGQAYLNGVKIWPDASQYVKALKLRFYGVLDDNSKVEVPSSRIKAWADAANVHADKSKLPGLLVAKAPTVTTGFLEIATFNPSFSSKYPLLTYNASSGLWEFSSSANVLASNFIYGSYQFEQTDGSSSLPSERLNANGTDHTVSLNVNTKLPVMPGDKLRAQVRNITNQYGDGIGISPQFTMICSQKSNSTYYFGKVYSYSPPISAFSEILSMSKTAWTNDFSDTASLPNSYFNMKIVGSAVNKSGEFSYIEFQRWTLEVVVESVTLR